MTYIMASLLQDLSIDMPSILDQLKLACTMALRHAHNIHLQRCAYMAGMLVRFSMAP